jgi:hypothetical protein
MNWTQLAFGHGCLVLVIIDNPDIMSVAVAPLEADTPLIVDADTPLSFTVAMQFFEAVGRRHPQIRERHRTVQHPELAERDLFAPHPDPPPQGGRDIF